MKSKKISRLEYQYLILVHYQSQGYTHLDKDYLKMLTDRVNIRLSKDGWQIGSTLDYLKMVTDRVNIRLSKDGNR